MHKIYWILYNDNLDEYILRNADLTDWSIFRGEITPNEFNSRKEALQYLKDNKDRFKGNEFIISETV